MTSLPQTSILAGAAVGFSLGVWVNRNHPEIYLCERVTILFRSSLLGSLTGYGTEVLVGRGIAYFESVAVSSQKLVDWAASTFDGTQIELGQEDIKPLAPIALAVTLIFIQLLFRFG